MRKTREQKKLSRKGEAVNTILPRVGLHEKVNIRESEEEQHQDTPKKLSEIEEAYTIEKLLKNEAYAFLLAEGLLDKFLDFREHFHRTKAQHALYNLVAEADMGGLWIDLFS